MVCGRCQKCRKPYVKSLETMGMKLICSRIETVVIFSWRLQDRSDEKRV